MHGRDPSCMTRCVDGRRVRGDRLHAIRLPDSDGMSPQNLRHHRLCLSRQNASQTQAECDGKDDPERRVPAAHEILAQDFEAG